MTQPETQPTTGPWNSENDLVFASDGDLLASFGSINRSVLENYANARLASASHDLAAVVRSYLDLDTWLDSSRRDVVEIAARFVTCRDAAEAALAKVYGKETPEQRGQLALMIAGPELLRIAKHIVELMTNARNDWFAELADDVGTLGGIIERIEVQPQEVRP